MDTSIFRKTIGVPLNRPFIDAPNKNHPFVGTSIHWNPPDLTVDSTPHHRQMRVHADAQGRVVRVRAGGH